MEQPKVWFITGASRGLGLEIAKAALQRGDLVVAAGRSLMPLAQALRPSNQVHHAVLDVTDEAAATRAVQAAINRFGRIDILVNNAGYGLLSAVEEASSDEVRQNYEVNVFGLLNVTRAVLPFMRQARRGHVINLSSVGGLTGFAGWGLYGSTKFAVEGITEALAAELAPLGISATSVAPGFFRTEFLDPTSLTRARNIIEAYATTVGGMRDHATQVNKKQPGDPRKLAQALLKLADAEKPPVHLPLGNDTLQFFQAKMDKFNAEIKEWHEVITSTDHDDVAVA